MEINKINLTEEDSNDESNESVITVPVTKGGKKKFIILGVVAILVAWLFFGIALPAKATYDSAKKAYDQTRKAYEAAKKQDIVAASQEFKKAHDLFVETQNKLKVLSYTRFIPLLGSYYSDIEHLVAGGAYGLEAAQITTDAILPYADVLGLKGQGSFVLGSAEERIKKTVETLDKVTPKISDIEGKIKLLRREIDQVNPNHYPNIGGRLQVNSQLTQLKTTVDQLDTFVSEAKPLIEVLPMLLGVPKDKKYLILFQNDKELRATGGFITAYSIFRLERGIIHVDRSDDIYGLDNTLRRRQKAPEPILKYFPKVTTFNLRDSNLSPDFVESMKTFNSLYKDAGGRVEVDGIIALDTHVLVSTIKILDDEVKAGGITFTTKEDKRCNCPQVIYVLEDNISRPVGFQREGRKDLIGVLLYAIMQKALSSSPKVYWGPLFQKILSEISEKHVLFYLYDDKAQKGLEALDASGRIKSYAGDYLHVNDTNFAGAKANMYVKHNVSQNIEVGGDGSLTKTIVIDYKNPAPPSDCNLESGGLCLNAELKNWLRIYVPKGSTLIESQGSEVEIKTSEELEKTVFEGFLKVRPLGKATFTIKYKLPFKKEGKELPLLIQKQPGTEGHDYQIRVNGKEIEKFQLTTDRELKLQI